MPERPGGVEIATMVSRTCSGLPCSTCRGLCRHAGADQTVFPADHLDHRAGAASRLDDRPGQRFHRRHPKRHRGRCHLHRHCEEPSGEHHHNAQYQRAGDSGDSDAGWIHRACAGRGRCVLGIRNHASECHHRRSVSRHHYTAERMQLAVESFAVVRLDVLRIRHRRRDSGIRLA